MIDKRRIRKNEEHLFNLIAASFCDDLYDLKKAQFVNCYAVSQGLMYPDKYHQYYTPGVIHRLQTGSGPIVTDQYDPDYVGNCFELDCASLNRKYEKVHYSDISQDDCKYYIGITEFQTLANTSDHHWHFIFRTPSGIWLHKPNWVDPIQTINWIDKGKSFSFDSTSAACLSDPFLNLKLRCQGTCFPEAFYAIDFPE